MNRRKWATAGLPLTMAAMLATACGGNTNDNGAQGTTGAVETTAQESASASQSAEVNKDPVTLRYLTWDYSDRTVSTDAWIASLKDNMQITIDMQNVPTDQYNVTLKTKYAATDLPDLVKTHGIDRKLNLSEKLTIDPDQFVDLSDLPAIADFVPSVIQDRKSNEAGKLYYVPVSTNALGVLYNKKTFADNGIAIPTTLDEFIAACEKLNSAGVTPIAAGFKDSWTTQIIPFIAFGQYVNAKHPEAKAQLADGTLKYADIKEDVLKALNVQLDWIDKGFFQKDILGTDINVASQMVGTGKAAMLINGTWQLGAVQASNPDAEIGFFALPLNAVGEKTILPTSADEGILINAKSKHLEKAKEALNAYLSAENQTLVINDLKGIPTNTKVQVTDPFVKEVQAAMAAADVQSDWWGGNGYYQPSGTAFSMDKSLQNLIAKGTTPEQFIADYDAANAKALGK
ncbi:ABC transporter substrate-binding protein [Cohnella sp. GCM10020058]|uniref:ABC transporter substrate-binding protein n=1 Tax=Cohnella sp. GCM10020058 TaxID=3317330 RepID=UPI00362B5717